MKNCLRAFGSTVLLMMPLAWRFPKKKRYQINGLNQVARNVQDGISLIQTAEGAIQEIHAMLQRMNTLAHQAANGTYTDDDRKKLQLEFSELITEINNIAENTKFNGIKLLNGFFTMLRGNINEITFSSGGIGLQLIIPQHNDINQMANDFVSLFNYVKSRAIKTNFNAEILNRLSMSASENRFFVHLDGMMATGGDNSFHVKLIDTPSGIMGFEIVDNSPDDGDFVSVGALNGTNDRIYFMFSSTATTTGGISIQTGIEANDTITLDMPNLTASKIGINNIDISTLSGAMNAIESIKKAITDVSVGRARLGAYQNRLEHILNNVQNYSENLSAAESRIRDADMAKEIMEITRNQILVNAGLAALAQANALPKKFCVCWYEINRLRLVPSDKYKLRFVIVYVSNGSRLLSI